MGDPVNPVPFSTQISFLSARPTAPPSPSHGGATASSSGHAPLPVSCLRNPSGCLRQSLGHPSHLPLGHLCLKQYSPQLLPTPSSHFYPDCHYLLGLFLTWVCAATIYLTSCLCCSQPALHLWPVPSCGLHRSPVSPLGLQPRLHSSATHPAAPGPAALAAAHVWPPLPAALPL